MRSIVPLLVLSLVPRVAEAVAAGPQRPNVLFIAVDDLNDFPTFTGRYPDAKTPHMDRLAARGMVFTRAHCQFPLCGPSRASVMSGLMPSTLGYTDHMQDEALASRARELGTELLHGFFAARGYRTLAVGKICHAHVPQGSVDASGGSGDFTAGLGRLGRHWQSDQTLTDWATAPERDAQMPDHEAADWAVRQLQAAHEAPFFLMVGFLRPHVPWYVPKRWFDLYDRDTITLPPYRADDLDDVPETARRIGIRSEMPRTAWAIENDQWRSIVQAYLASISFADHQVGRVLDALDAGPHKDNTVVVLWSDHGYHMGEKNTFQKHSLWERSSHVPLVIAGPTVRPGQRCDRVVSLIDLYPTLLEMTGLPANPKNEGRSLAPLLAEPARPWPHPAVTGWHDDSFAVQTETHRYIRYGDGAEELYDHRSDPDEWHNLAHGVVAPADRDRMARLRSSIPSARPQGSGSP